MDPSSNRFVPLTEPSVKDAAKNLRESLDEVRKTMGLPDPIDFAAQLTPESKAVPEALSGLVLPDGNPVPKHWSVFEVGEDVVIKGYTFRVVYVGETSILFEPVGIPIVGEDKG